MLLGGSVRAEGLSVSLDVSTSANTISISFSTAAALDSTAGAFAWSISMGVPTPLADTSTGTTSVESVAGRSSMRICARTDASSAMSASGGGAFGGDAGSGIADFSGVESECDVPVSSAVASSYEHETPSERKRFTHLRLIRFLPLQHRCLDLDSPPTF